MAVPFLPQAKLTTDPRHLGDVTEGLSKFGDAVGEGIAKYRERNALMEIGQAAAGGNLQGAQEAAFKLGKPELGLQVNNMLQQRANRSEDVSFRNQQAERSQSNADRSFGLQASNAAEDRAFRREQFSFEKDYKEKELGLKRLAAEFKNQGGYKDIKERAEVEGGLRKEYTKLSDDFIKVRDAYGRIQASAENPSAAGDLALIFNYMKMLDPGSTVREGEFATAQNSAGIPDRIRAQWNKTLTGERLAPEVRKDFLDRSGMLFETQAGQHKKLTDQFKGIGERLGVDVQNAVPDMTAPAAPATPPSLPNAGGSLPAPPSGFQLVK